MGMMLVNYALGVIIGGTICYLYFKGKEQESVTKIRHIGHTSKMKKLWLIWCRTVDHRIGKTDDDEPQIPILSLSEANISLLFRTGLIIINVVTCLFIIANIIHKW